MVLQTFFFDQGDAIPPHPPSIRALGVFTPVLFGSIESDSSSFPPLVRIFLGRCEYSNHTRVQTKQLYRDPAEEVVSVHFQMNSGTVEWMNHLSTCVVLFPISGSLAKGAV